eukprot:477134-Rhodomonas_salina.2
MSGFLFLVSRQPHALRSDHAWRIRFKIIPASAFCGEANDQLGAVDGGSGRQSLMVTDNGASAQVPFTVATTAIGAAKLCVKHAFSCEYQLAALIAVNAPAITAIGDARK